MYTHEVVCLSITTFVGTCVMGAVHWYGRLHWRVPEDAEHRYCQRDVNYVLGTESAARLSEWDADGPPYKVGDTSIRFFSEEHLRLTAQRTWKTVVPRGRVLIVCQSGELGPVEVLAGPSKLIRLGNQLWQSWEKIDFNTAVNDPRYLSLEKQWNALWQRAGFLT